jgi:hypothetical protein
MYLTSMDTNTTMNGMVMKFDTTMNDIVMKFDTTTTKQSGLIWVFVLGFVLLSLVALTFFNKRKGNTIHAIPIESSTNHIESSTNHIASNTLADTLQVPLPVLDLSSIADSDRDSIGCTMQVEPLDVLKTKSESLKTKSLDILKTKSKSIYYPCSSSI